MVEVARNLTQVFMQRLGVSTPIIIDRVILFDKVYNKILHSKDCSSAQHFLFKENITGLLFAFGIPCVRDQ
jgi:hypothetical protein